MTDQINVNLTDRSYSISIEPGLLAHLGEKVRSVASPDRVMLVIDAKIAETHGQIAMASLCEAGFETKATLIEAKETNKTLSTVRRLYEELLGHRMERSSLVIALGGGIVGDTAGFAAATFLRGLPVIQVPTTLLAMVDASVGGKTGVNIELPGDGDVTRLGKNLIGAFWQPKCVLIDPATLQTLDDRELKCGLAECVKHGLIADRDLLGFIDANVENILEKNIEKCTELIHRSVQIKARVVAEDELEQGQRALLNLGHTFAHAIEPVEQLNLKHGEAVAIGLLAAMCCSVETSRCEADEVNKLDRLLERIGLPRKLAVSVDPRELLHTMHFDKKVQAGVVRLALPTARGAEIVSDVPEQTILDAWRFVGARSSVPASS